MKNNANQTSPIAMLWITYKKHHQDYSGPMMGKVFYRLTKLVDENLICKVEPLKLCKCAGITRQELIRGLEWWIEEGLITLNNNMLHFNL